MNDTDRTLETLLALQARRHRAMLDADLSALDALLDDDLAYTHSNASRDDKASYLEKVRSGVMHYTAISTSDEEVRLVGRDCACVLGRMRLAGEIGGAASRFDNRFLAVWARHGATWRLAVFQPTPLHDVVAPDEVDATGLR